MTEALGHAALGGVGTRAALGCEAPRRGIGRAPQVTEHAQIRRAGQRAFERDAIALQVRVEPHGAEADGALAARRVARRVSAKVDGHERRSWQGRPFNPFHACTEFLTLKTATLADPAFPAAEQKPVRRAERGE